MKILIKDFYVKIVKQQSYTQIFQLSIVDTIIKMNILEFTVDKSEIYKEKLTQHMLNHDPNYLTEYTVKITNDQKLRGSNGFIIFRTIGLNYLKKEYPYLNMNMRPYSQSISKIWNRLTRKQKDNWNIVATDIHNRQTTLYLNNVRGPITIRLKH